MGGGRHQTGGGKGMKQGGTTGTADGKSAAAGSAAVGSAATGATATGSAATGSTDTSVDDSTSMKGIKAVAELRIDGGSFTINSADDSIHSNSSVTVNGGSFEIASGDDGFHADETLAISDGTINISESYEGLEGLHILVSGGNIKLTAKDDGLNAAGGADSSGMGGRDAMAMGGGRGGFSSSSGGTIQISGGTIYVSASGDGIDANGSVEITGGYTVVCGPTQGDTSVLDYDSKASISGGTFIGTGAASMTQTFSNAEQGVLAVKSGDQESGSEVTLSDNNGNVLITHVPELSYQVVIISSPDIVKGETYTITAGEASGEFTAD